MNSRFSRMRFRKKEIQDQKAKPHTRRTNALLTLSAFDGPAIPCRPKDRNHNTNAVTRAIPALYRYPRVVRRTILGRIANKASFSWSVTARVAEAGFALSITPCCTWRCTAESLDNRYFVRRPEASGSKTNGAAIIAAPL